jgi:hypothetical protein
LSTETVMPSVKTWQEVSPESLSARRKALSAAALHGLCEARSGAMATTMPSTRSNRPEGCSAAQVRNSSRVWAVSGSCASARDTGMAPDFLGQT